MINNTYLSKKLENIYIYSNNVLMNFDTALITFGIASLAIGVTLLTIYSSFGPGSENLIDPFEEDDD